MEDHQLITERCRIRRLSHKDDEHVWTAAHSPGFTDGMTWEPPATHEEMDAFTDEALQLWDAGQKFVWTIEDKDTGAFIGRIEVCKDTKIPGNVWGLGYWIFPSEQGKGYATEAGRAVLQFAFETLHADAIVSGHHDWNAASGRVLTKIGMKHTGFAEGRTMKRGKPVRSSEFWLDRKDWDSTL